MQKEGEGIILKAQKHGENSVILRIFSEEFGLIAGLVKGAAKKRADLTHGNIVHFIHSKRLESQLGIFQIERLFSPSIYVYDDFLRLQILDYQCALINDLLTEEVPQEVFYRQTLQCLKEIAHPKNILERLALWELDILKAVGFAPNLERDEAVPCPENSPLYYVSPRTGRMVPQAMGAPYHAKLLILPKFLGGIDGSMLDVFKLTGHFLNHALTELAPRKNLDSRSTLLEYIRDNATHA